MCRDLYVIYCPQKSLYFHGKYKKGAIFGDKEHAQRFKEDAGWLMVDWLAVSGIISYLVPVKE